MGFRVSPGVSITEKDLTTIIPAVATTPGGFAGYFHWGPANEIVTVTNEKELVDIFGEPQTDNYVDFFTVANFLGYGNNCGVVRTVATTAYNSNVSTALTGVTVGNIQILNTTAFDSATTGVSGAAFFGRYPGVLGNSLKVVVTSGSGISSGYALSAAASLGASSISFFTTAGITRSFSIGDDIIFGDGTIVTLAGVTGNTNTASNNPVFKDFFGCAAAATLTLTLNEALPKAQASGNTFSVRSVYAKMISTTATTTSHCADSGGSNDLVNVIVLDADGTWTGTANTMLEKFEGLSRATGAIRFDGSSNYFRNVINETSKYIRCGSADIMDDTTAALSAAHTSLSGGSALNTLLQSGVFSLPLKGGTSGAPDDSLRWQNGWSLFADASAVDVSLLPLGNASAALCSLVIQNVCEPRKDCMAFVSPTSASVVNKLPYEALSAIKTYRDSTLNINSSYAVMDSGWKYQLDTYNGIVRTMPLNPDIAGLVARTEFTNDAWFSPAGFNRGQIKNAIKLAYNPTSEGHRDELYQRQVNPVVAFPGEGTILFGDKTMQTRPSAFDRINVRRLFIVLEKAVATASKFFLFEQNDAFTRATFKNLVVPFLKTVQQRRGITDFLVVCDDTNNTGEIIDRNEFVADIFIKPTRSINFIQLNFVATRTGVSFTEVAGA